MIVSADYSRRGMTTCDTNVASETSNTNCRSVDTQLLLQDRCDGEVTCDIPTTNDMEGLDNDPCSKYVTIFHDCILDLDVKCQGRI